MAKQIKLDRRIFLNADKTKVCETGDPACRFLYGGIGDAKDADEANKLGYKPLGGKKQAATPENKKLETPENKGKKK